MCSGQPRAVSCRLRSHGAGLVLEVMLEKPPDPEGLESLHGEELGEWEKTRRVGLVFGQGLCQRGDQEVLKCSELQNLIVDRSQAQILVSKKEATGGGCEELYSAPYAVWG